MTDLYIFFANRNIEPFESSSECQAPGGSRRDSKSLRRLEQAQRADSLLALTRQQRLQAVGAVRRKPEMIPLTIKINRLSEEYVCSMDSHSPPGDRGSAAGSTRNYAKQLDEVDAKDVGVESDVGCGDNAQSGKVGSDVEATSAPRPLDVVVRRRSKMSRKRKADQLHDAEGSGGREAAASHCLVSEDDNSTVAIRSSEAPSSAVTVSSSKSGIIPSVSSCNVAASTFTVAESQQQVSSDSCAATFASLGTKQQHNSIIGDGASDCGRDEDAVGNHSCYADANNGTERRCFAPESPQLATSAGLAVTGVRGKVRGRRRGRPYGSRGAQRAHNGHLSNSELGTPVDPVNRPGRPGGRCVIRGTGTRGETNSLHQDVVDGTSHDGGMAEMCGTTSFAHQFSAVPGHDVVGMHYDPYVADPLVAGELKPTVLALLLYLEFLFCTLFCVLCVLCLVLYAFDFPYLC